MRKEKGTMKRKQFTFYESWYEVLKDLQPEDQLALWMAIISYALEDKEPELEGLPAELFAQIRPGIDSEREEAEESGQPEYAEPEEDGVLPFQDEMEENDAWIPVEYLHTMEDLSDEEFGRLMRWCLAYSETGEEDRVELTGKERLFRETCLADLDWFCEWD